MADASKLKLVDGIFNSEDARDILCHLINKKINFHSCRIFSLDERFGIEDEYSKKRIKELTALKSDILEIIEQAKLTGKNLEVHADIQINFTDHAATSAQGKTKELSV